MIDEYEAVHIASQIRPGAKVSGVMANDKGFVVGFLADADAFDNLTVYVDNQTGKADTLGASEYSKLLPTLHEIG